MWSELEGLLEQQIQEQRGLREDTAQSYVKRAEQPGGAALSLCSLNVSQTPHTTEHHLEETRASFLLGKEGHGPRDTTP